MGASNVRFLFGRSSFKSTTIVAILLLIGLVSLNTALASSRDDVKGMWASPGSIFRITEEAGGLQGEIIVIKDDVYTVEEDAEREGMVRRDDNNPDSSMRSRTLVGINMFSDYEYQGGQWQGLIYDPESGNTYQSKMKLKKGNLEIRGYIGMPMFGRTAVFRPVSSCETYITELLAQIDQQGSCSAD
jgi:uncharacterized protein (DUF2147 family)